MTQHHTFTTTLTLPSDKEQEVTVTYTYYAGYDGGSHAIDPPEPASVEIQSVLPDVPLECWDDLVEEAFADYQDYVADAAEYRADAAREARWERD